MPSNDAVTADGAATPYEEKIAGETEIEWQCGVAASDQFDEDDPEFCAHEPETVTLDDPAFIDDRGKIHLPGRPVACPECGNPHDFLINGERVIFA